MPCDFDMMAYAEGTERSTRKMSESSLVSLSSASSTVAYVPAGPMDWLLAPVHRTDSGGVNFSKTQPKPAATPPAVVLAPRAPEVPLTGDWICYNCADACGRFDESVPEEYKYCPACGTHEHRSQPAPSRPPAPEPRADPSTDWSCEDCSDPLPAAWLFCPDCGPRSDHSWVCGNCGEPSSGTCAFCPDCGTPKHKDESNPPPQPPQPPPRVGPEVDWECVNCKTEAPASFKFCPDCGSHCSTGSAGLASPSPVETAKVATPSLASPSPVAMAKVATAEAVAEPTAVPAEDANAMAEDKREDMPKHMAEKAAEAHGAVAPSAENVSGATAAETAPQAIAAAPSASEPEPAAATLDAPVTANAAEPATTAASDASRGGAPVAAIHTEVEAPVAATNTEVETTPIAAAAQEGGVTTPVIAPFTEKVSNEQDAKATRGGEKQRSFSLFALCCGSSTARDVYLDVLDPAIDVKSGP